MTAPAAAAAAEEAAGSASACNPAAAPANKSSGHTHHVWVLQSQGQCHLRNSVCAGGGGGTGPSSFTCKGTYEVDTIWA